MKRFQGRRNSVRYCLSGPPSSRLPACAFRQPSGSAFWSTSGLRRPSAFPLHVPVNLRLAPSIGLSASPSSNFQSPSDIDPPAVPSINFQLASATNHQRCQRPTSNSFRILALLRRASDPASDSRRLLKSLGLAFEPTSDSSSALCFPASLSG